VIWEILGHEMPSDAHDLVFQIARALYGDALKNIGFKQSRWDTSVFTKCVNGETVTLASHVDDFIATSPSDSLLADTIAEIERIFELKNLGSLGEANDLLGIEISYDRENGITELHQPQYMWKVMEKFSLTQRAAVTTPNRPKRESDQLSRATIQPHTVPLSSV
jgi:hypothetical protein